MAVTGTIDADLIIVGNTVMSASIAGSADRCEPLRPYSVRSACSSVHRLIARIGSSPPSADRSSRRPCLPTPSLRRDHRRRRGSRCGQRGTAGELGDQTVVQFTVRSIRLRRAAGRFAPTIWPRAARFFSTAQPVDLSIPDFVEPDDRQQLHRPRAVTSTTAISASTVRTRCWRRRRCGDGCFVLEHHPHVGSVCGPVRDVDTRRTTTKMAAAMPATIRSSVLFASPDGPSRDDLTIVDMQ